MVLSICSAVESEIPYSDSEFFTEVQQDA